MSKVNAAFLKRIDYIPGYWVPIAARFTWSSTPEGFFFWMEERKRQIVGRPLSSKAARILRRWKAAERKLSTRKEGKH